MNTIPVTALDPLLVSLLSRVESAYGKVKSSFEELIGRAQELACAEDTAQSALACAADVDEDENPQVNDALSLRDDARFDLSVALDRALREVAHQERTLNETRSALEQVKESLHLDNHELTLSMQLSPKPGCATFAPRTEK
jgi:hypothetical protein